MKHFALLGLLVCLSAFSLQGQKSTRYISIKSDSVELQKIESYKNFTFIDSSGKMKKGKIVILNDSQFSFVNFFMEPIGKIYNISDVKEFYIPETKMRKLSATQVVLIAFFIPGGIYYLLIREIVRVVKKDKNKSQIATGWLKMKEYSICIENYSITSN